MRKDAGFVRLDDGKLNLSLKSDPTWYRLASVNIENGTAEYPSGDNIQATEVWTPPDMWKNLPTTTVNAILDDFEKGIEGGDRYSTGNRAEDRAAWKILIKHAPDLTKEQATKALDTWTKNAMIAIDAYHSPKKRKEAQGIFVLKRPG